MNPAASLALTFFVPFIPWLGLSPWWGAARQTPERLGALFVSGLVGDLLWAHPLGGLSALLLSLTALTILARRIWPADPRAFSIAAAAFSTILVGLYLSL